MCCPEQVALGLAEWDELNPTWPVAQSDIALHANSLSAGLHAEELRGANVGDIRTTDDGGGNVIHFEVTGGKERCVPIEAELLAVV